MHFLRSCFQNTFAVGAPPRISHPAGGAYRGGSLFHPKNSTPLSTFGQTFTLLGPQIAALAALEKDSWSLRGIFGQRETYTCSTLLI